MASELRVNKLTNRSGLGTVTYSDTGAVLSGITTGTFSGNITGTASNASGATGDFSIADKIIHTGDTNTAIRFPGNDTFQVETDGSARLKITDSDLTMLDYASGDKVGIGTNVLVAKLDVRNNSNIPVLKLMDSHYNKYLTIRGGGSPNRMVIDAYEGSGGGADIDLASNGSTKVRITSAGKIGINTTVPADLLSIGVGANTLAFGAKDTTRGNHIWQLLNNDNSGNAEFRMYKNSVTGTHAQSINFATSGDANYILDGPFLLGLSTPSYGSGDIQHEIKKNNSRTYTAALMNAHSHLLLNNSDTTTGAFCGIGIRAGTGDGSIGYVYNGSANSSDFVINTDGGANGVERLRIDNGGDIFIGTSTDIAPANGTNLCVSDATISRLILEKQSTIKFGLNVSSGFTIYDETNDAARFSIASDGKVSIGNLASPDSLLHIHAGSAGSASASSSANLTIESSGSYNVLQFLSPSTAAQQIRFGDTSDNGAGYIQYNHDGNALTIGVNGPEKFRINSDGEMGVGTNNPTALLHVSKSVSTAYDATSDSAQRSDTATINIENNDGTTNSFAQIAFDTAGSNQSIARIVALRTGAASNALTFVTEHSNTKAERLRIDSNGYIGINQTTPQRYLHITGNDGATGATLGNSDTQLVIDNTGGNGAIVEFLSSNNGAGRIMFTDTDGSNRGRMEYSHNGDYLRFDAAGQECMRVKTVTANSITSGAVGINDTSPDGEALGLVVKNKNFQETSKPVVHIERVNSAGGGSGTDEIALNCKINTTYNGAGDSFAIKSFGRHNLNSTHYAGHFEAHGSQYDAGGDGAAVYATTHKTDTNGGGYVPCFYAYGRSTYNIASNGYAVGMRIKLNAYEQNRGIQIHHELTNSNWTRMISFHKGSGANGTEVGSIKSSNNATQYNTSSDYRLKENVVDLTGAITRLKQLKPKRFNFKNDTSKTVDGFIAHEVEPVVPQAVSGAKDAVKIETIADPETGKTIMNEDGTPKTETVIDAQEVDYSKLSTLTIAALQEAIAEIETLKTKVAALESS